ncbi:unnamed protein product [Parascedosporium putredinis]|uniref:Mid2 domain-containing protein n=1 Tax=Parascedosporium putredinis TaxID=1442378 RepID=A0A9P1HAN6_9PEZI|nr:unnamed protein product [Parascedosporium putredinis]CAI8002266.1 unnamed protein product [Parascedosporium putredinis]
MVMGLRTIVPLALYLGGAAAFDPDFAWHEARQTDGDLAKMAGIVPLATAAPEPGLLQKRGTNTCGFIDGDARQGITCRADLGAECLYDSTASAIGCCATTSCSIWTACLPFTSSDATSTVDLERTRYCSNSALPHCAVYKFEDPVWTGYTIAVCDSVSSTYSFFPSPLGVTTTSSRGRTTTTSTTSETSTSSRTSTSPGPTTTTSEPSGGGAPVGAIVGGVIGGLAVLALFAVGLFFILRRLKQKGNNNVPPTGPPMMAAAIPPPGPQAPPHQPYTPDPMKPQMYAGAPSSVPSMYGPQPEDPTDRLEASTTTNPR